MIDEKGHAGKKLFQHTHFGWAIVAQFFYVAAQVGIAALFINYCTEKNVGINNERASYLLSGSLILFTIHHCRWVILLIQMWLLVHVKI